MYTDYRTLTNKADTLLSDWKNQTKLIEEVDQSIRYQELNLRALHSRRDKIIRRGEVAESMIGGLPDLEAQLIRDRLGMPRQSTEYYALRLKVSKTKYQEVYRQAMKDMAEILLREDGWESL